MAASGAAPEVQQSALSNLVKDIDEEYPAENSALESGGTDLVESMTVSVRDFISTVGCSRNCSSMSVPTYVCLEIGCHVPAFKRHADGTRTCIGT